MEFLTRARTWLLARLAERRAQLRLSLRMTVAAALTFGISQWLHLPWALWAVLTAVILTQMSVGKSLIATIDYMAGTLGGAVYSGLVGLIFPHDTNLEIAVTLAVAVGPLSLLASSNSRFAAAPFTAVMVLLLPTVTHASPLQSATYRVIEVAVGCATALAVSFFVLPQRAHGLVYEATAKILTRMADLLPVLVADLKISRPDTPAQRLQGRVGEAFRKLAAINIEAARERSAYLNSDPDPQPLIDVTLRLRHDIVLMGRAAIEPLPPPVLERLEAPIEHFSLAAREFLISCAAALTARSEPARLDAIDKALADFAAAFTGIRRNHLLQNVATDTVERVFALGFCFEQMHADLAVLATTADKIKRGPRPTDTKKADAQLGEIA
ncbi:FUSC family protein [uncultured Methylovirgula sp.]|uniref:FUSC family protein n=1 Tax=uncultured Methylovirgula sp. TaxID=1285960 RepID=UPI002604356E|nr:FUSC family protein [uncultured Methylovirgula sp.]